MDRGEIWLVSLDPIAGHEQSGKRPVLIVSQASFNKLTRLPVIVPVTSGGNFARAAGLPSPWTAREQKQRALFAATSPELLIWAPGTVSGWNVYPTLL
ncbi:transcriptional modulator of MazE/toxin, MazF [Salmonella enterica subsp. enterica serovar Meleagridis]|nr:transcriptional modulator of MazE/toxin, MazF [Salmonella enterica subsp. enterica serovar Meleagridis str. 0047]